MILLMPEQQQAAAQVRPAGTAAPLCRRGSPRGPWSHLPLPTPALQAPLRDHRDIPKLASLAFSRRAPGPCTDGIPRYEIRWEQVGVSLGKGPELPSRPPQPSGGSTSGPHRARSEPILQLPPSGLWVTRGCSKNRPQTKASPWASLQRVLPIALPRAPSGMADLLCSPPRSASPGCLGRCSPPPPKTPLSGSCKSYYMPRVLGAGRHARWVNQPAAAQPQLYTPGVRLPRHPGAPLPGAGPTGLPPQGGILPTGSLPMAVQAAPKWVLVGPSGAKGYRAGAAEVSAGSCQTQAGSRVSAWLRGSTVWVFHPAFAAEG